MSPFSASILVTSSRWNSSPAWLAAVSALPFGRINLFAMLLPSALATRQGQRVTLTGVAAPGPAGPIESGLAGATVLRGIEGFGAHSRIHTSRILRLSEDLPLVIEIVDSEDKINAFLAVLDGMMESGLLTLEKVQVLQYGREAPGS